MKLSRLYTNRPSSFDALDFTEGLNVILAEIRLPENLKKDTHNLGKTTIGKLIDFCLLSRTDPKLFLFKNKKLFEEFVFFLEIQLLDASFLTIRRSVVEPSKLSFKRHQRRTQDYSQLDVTLWDHFDVPFDLARTLLDGILDLQAWQPWGFRKGMGYQVRSQADYQDVFQLSSGYKHREWKPFLARVLGFDAGRVNSLYEKDAELDEKQKTIGTIQDELHGSTGNISKIDGLLQLKRSEALKKQTLLDAFDFRTADKEKTKDLVDEVDARIALLNAERYSLNVAKKKISTSLEKDQVLFNPDAAQRLFAEAGLLFPQQLKKDYEQLIAFNQALTDERREYLAEELAEITGELRRVSAELNTLGRRRVEMLAFLKDTDIFTKYRHLSDELVTLRADIAGLERQRGSLDRLQALRTEVRTLTEEKGRLQDEIELDVDSQNTEASSLFSQIRLFFNDVIENVLDRKALLSVATNNRGHLEFKAEILDEAGNATSADQGTSYRKLLCMAFDIAVLRAQLTEKAPHFVFHDGVFETLDVRKKIKLLAVIREYADVGLQFIVTLIDTDLPKTAKDEPPLFADDEVILRLHDEGPSGRLFKMAAW